MAQEFPPAPVQPAPRRNNTVMIILLVLVVICVCCALILWVGYTFGDTVVEWFRQFFGTDFTGWLHNIALI